MSDATGGFSADDWSARQQYFDARRAHFPAGRAQAVAGTAPSRTARAIALPSGDTGALLAWGLPTLQCTMMATGWRAWHAHMSGEKPGALASLH
jgi:hypothetical protein